MTDSIEDFIYKNRIKEQLDRLSEKYKDKRVLIYGTGKLFQKIKELYSFDNFNVVGVSDVKYYDLPELETEYNYKIYTPDKIVDAMPEVVLCCLQCSYSVVSELKEYFKCKNYNADVICLKQKGSLWDSICKRIYKYLYKPKRKNNHVYVIDAFGTKKEYTKKIPGLKIVFYGDNNTVIIRKNSLNKIFNSSLYLGNDGYVFIDDANQINNSCFFLSADTPMLKIGRNIFINNCRIIITRAKGLSVTIGDNCAFATDVYIRPSDGHVVYDEQTKKILNKDKNIVIGNKVWLGYNTTILKGAVIPDNTIVASNNLVNKPFQESNTILAGIPAKVVKTGVNWDVKQPSLFSDFYE